MYGNLDSELTNDALGKTLKKRTKEDATQAACVGNVRGTTQNVEITGSIIGKMMTHSYVFRLYSYCN